MDYELIDSGNGRRLERFGDYILDRPDPEVLWQKSLQSTLQPSGSKSENGWESANAIFLDRWINPASTEVLPVPDKWILEHDGIKFWTKLAPFKHTGVFPEQEVQWNWISNSIKSVKTVSKACHQMVKPVKVLNLFAYTGIASLFAAKAGGDVTHLDASRPSVTWANDNAKLNGISNIRWIIDDAIKFTEREIKRGVKYDAIMMDPPVYGHGPTGQVWDFNRDFPKLLDNCRQIVSKSPLFILVNAYAISSSSTTLANTLQGYFADLGGKITNGELTLKETSADRLLSTGIWARWES